MRVGGRLLELGRAKRTGVRESEGRSRRCFAELPLKLAGLLDSIAETDRDGGFASLDRFDSAGKVVSLWTRECRLAEASWDDTVDCRRKAEILRSALEIDRYNPPGCSPNGEDEGV